MQLDFNSGLPEPQKDILRQLQDVCRDLFVIRSRWVLNYKTLKPYEHPNTGEMVEKPRYWVCNKAGGRYSVLFPVQTPEGDYMPFDVRTVRRIQTDIARLTPEEQEKLLKAIEERKAEAREKEDTERNRRIYENNKPAFRAAIENAKSGVTSVPIRTRDGKLFSYSGQTKHGSSGQVILTPKEKGLDIPEKGDL